jgi:hypothetical protein
MAAVSGKRGATLTPGNRPEKVGYSVNVIAWDSASGRPKAASDSKDAAVAVFSNKDLTKCPRGCFRPVGLAWGTQERLFVASDTTGEIYVIANDGGKDSSAAHLAPSAAVLVAGMLLGLVL